MFLGCETPDALQLNSVSNYQLGGRQLNYSLKLITVHFSESGQL